MEATILRTGIESSAAGVTIRGAVIEKVGWLGIKATAPVAIEDSEIRYAHATGLRLVGNDHVVRRNFIHHNGNTGIVATDGARLLMEMNEVAFNNYLHFGGRPVPHHEGAAKFLHTSDVTVRGNYSHHNDGDGWWFDTDNIRIVVQDNVFEANSRYGFFYEVSYDALIRNNVFSRNATDPTWQGSGLRIGSSKNVEVADNRFEDSRWSTLNVNWANRGSGAYGEHQLTGLFVHDNVFQLSNGWVGTPYGLDAITAASSNNRFQGNRYIVPDVSGSWWMWGPGKRIGWAKWNAFGFDLGGSVAVG
jgi:nitrous oxidase accessory protein NosD